MHGHFDGQSAEPNSTNKWSPFKPPILKGNIAWSATSPRSTPIPSLKPILINGMSIWRQSMSPLMKNLTDSSNCWWMSRKKVRRPIRLDIKNWGKSWTISRKELQKRLNNYWLRNVSLDSREISKKQTTFSNRWLIMLKKLSKEKTEQYRSCLNFWQK